MMLFLDVLVWLALAKIAVLILEDASYAVRGKQSPRMRERTRRRAEDATNGEAPAPAGGWGRTWSAVGGYTAGLVEDATKSARTRRRRRNAKRRGAKAVNGVVVDVDDDGRFYADCDLCDWSSRGFRLENNARLAGAEHTRTAHPDQRGNAQTKKEDDDPDNTDGTDDQPGVRRWTPRVIPGGAADSRDPDPAQPGDSAPPTEPDDALSRMHDRVQESRRAREATDYLRCPNGCRSLVFPGRDYCPECLEEYRRRGQTPPPVAARPKPDGSTGYGWKCPRCGAEETGLPYEDMAETRRNLHAQVCIPPAHRAPQPAPLTEDHDIRPAPETQDEVNRLRNELYGKCGHRTRRDGFLDEWCDNPNMPDSPYCWEHDPTKQPPGTPSHEEQPAEAADSNHITDPNNAKETNVNLEATGPEEIRSAFQTAIDTTGERSEEIGGIAAVLSEAADRYESLNMAPSTVAHIRDASEAFAAAQASLATATEELEAAMADFNTKDGQVADAATDAGNLADREVLVG